MKVRGKRNTFTNSQFITNVICGYFVYLVDGENGRVRHFGVLLFRNLLLPVEEQK